MRCYLDRIMSVSLHYTRKSHCGTADIFQFLYKKNAYSLHTTSSQPTTEKRTLTFITGKVQKHKAWTKINFWPMIKKSLKLFDQFVVIHLHTHTQPTQSGQVIEWNIFMPQLLIELLWFVYTNWSEQHTPDGTIAPRSLSLSLRSQAADLVLFFHDVPLSTLHVPCNWRPFLWTPLWPQKIITTIFSDVIWLNVCSHMPFSFDLICLYSFWPQPKHNILSLDRERRRWSCVCVRKWAFHGVLARLVWPTSKTNPSAQSTKLCFPSFLSVADLYFLFSMPFYGLANINKTFHMCVRWAHITIAYTYTSKWTWCVLNWYEIIRFPSIEFSGLDPCTVRSRMSRFHSSREASSGGQTHTHTILWKPTRTIVFVGHKGGEAVNVCRRVFPYVASSVRETEIEREIHKKMIIHFKKTIK